MSRCPTAWPTRKARICCSTPRIQWTGIPGATRRLRGRVTEDKPIFLSVGYSTCHWCHVMEHESFEQASVADVLNQSFVSIKVDREERPGRRPRLHDVRAGHHRRGRLAHERVADAGAEAVLRRHLLPAGVALQPAWVRRGAAGHRASLARRARADRVVGHRVVRRMRESATARPGWHGRRGARRAGTGCRRVRPVLRRAPWRIRQRAEVPTTQRAAVPVARACAHTRAGTARPGAARLARDGAGRHARSHRRRLPPLLGR